MTIFMLLRFGCLFETIYCKFNLNSLGTRFPILYLARRGFTFVANTIHIWHDKFRKLFYVIIITSKGVVNINAWYRSGRDFYGVSGYENIWWLFNGLRKRFATNPWKNGVRKYAITLELTKRHNKTKSIYTPAYIYIYMWYICGNSSSLKSI